MNPFNYTKKLPFLLVVLLFLGGALQAQKKTLGIGAVEVTPSLLRSASNSGSGNVLSRISQSMDGELIDKMHNTRKFDVFARSDLDQILKEQEFANSGNVDIADQNTAKVFEIAGIQYLLTTQITDFQDHMETAYFETLDETINKRTIRLGAVAKIYDTTTGKLLESASFQIDTGGHEGRERYIVDSSGTLSDQFIQQLGMEMAENIANRVVEALYPARVIGLTSDRVTINRGDGTRVAVGQIWEVFALGEEMIDPDTGESLGNEETSIGQIRITRVTPKTSQAEILENYGIEKLQVVRLLKESSQNR